MKQGYVGEDIQEILKGRKKSAEKGREYWLQLKEQYLLDEGDGLVILQTNDPEMIRAAIRLLPGYLRRKYLQKAVVVSVQEFVPDLLEEMSGRGGILLCLTDRERMECLLDYYRLVQFFSEIVVVSVEEPYGNPYIIGKAGIGMEDYVRNALYV